MTVSADFRPSRCCLVIVDFQNDYCDPEGALARMGQDTSEALVLLPRLRALYEQAHQARVPVIFLVNSHSHWTDAPAWARRGEDGESMDVTGIPPARAGSWGAEPFGIVPADDDLVIPKYRYSGFQYTPLELVLRTKGIESVLLTGTQTDVCVYATACDAIMRGFFPIVVEDCSMSGTPERHAYGLRQQRELVGGVVSSSEVIAAWAGQPAVGGDSS